MHDLSQGSFLRFRLHAADFASKHGVLDLTIDDDVFPARIGASSREGRVVFSPFAHVHRLTD